MAMFPIRLMLPHILQNNHNFKHEHIRNKLKEYTLQAYSYFFVNTNWIISVKFLKEFLFFIPRAERYFWAEGWKVGKFCLPLQKAINI